MRYVSDVPYMPTFIDEIAPEWLDLAATLCGFLPPDRTCGYRWCELGCGQGITPIVLAATRARGHFTGIDMMPDHIAAAEGVAAASLVGNVEFHALDFAKAAERDQAPFDYIVAHGVYSWVDSAAIEALHRFVERKLAPGGLFYVSYNAMPGWAADAPFQHLARALAADAGGASDQRFAAAAATIRELTDAGAASLQASPVATRLAAAKDDRPLAYFAHEYLAPAWRPRYVTEVRAALAAIGLTPVASATLVENFDDLTLRKKAQQALAAIESLDLRELARDFFFHQRFRRDIFGREAVRLTATKREQRLLEMHFALLRPASMVDYAMGTTAGRVSFDNPVARALVTSLGGSPRPLAQFRDEETPTPDLIANMLMLCCAGMATPTPGPMEDVSALNEVLLQRGEAESALQVATSATAMRFSRDLLIGKVDSDSARAWRQLLPQSGPSRLASIIS